MIPSFPVAGLMLAAPRGAALGVDIFFDEPFYESDIPCCGHTSMTHWKPALQQSDGLHNR
jgi:hypothetical protein